MTDELRAAIRALLDEAEDTVDLNSNDRGTSSRISSNTILDLERAFHAAERRAKEKANERAS